MTDNEKIAKFMGYKKDSAGLYLIHDMAAGRLSALFREDQVLYRTSWDWLMPVVEKIEQVIKDKMKELGPEITELNDPKGWRAWDYRRVRLSTKIDKVYNQSVEFIDWYSTQKV